MINSLHEPNLCTIVMSVKKYNIVRGRLISVQNILITFWLIRQHCYSKFPLVPRSFGKQLGFFVNHTSSFFIISWVKHISTVYQ